MERSILAITAENILTVWLMVILLLVAFAVAGKVWSGIRGRVQSGATPGGIPSEDQWTVLTGGAAIG